MMNARASPDPHPLTLTLRLPYKRPQKERKEGPLNAYFCLKQKELSIETTKCFEKRKKEDQSI